LTTDGGGTTCVVAETVTPAVAWKTTVVGADTKATVPYTAACVAPTGTVKLEGIEKTAGLELLSVTGRPPGGAAPVKKSVIAALPGALYAAGVQIELRSTPPQDAGTIRTLEEMLFDAAVAVTVATTTPVVTLVAIGT
jgi:hypothetical protein